jgi:hypothetical protein
MTKNTYGTGSFVLMNVGSVPRAGRGHAHHRGVEPRPTPPPRRTPSRARSSSPAPRCSGCATASDHRRGRRDRPARRVGARHRRRVLVPAFTGLGSPWWDPYARGTIVGITRGTTRAHLARATVESMAYQTRDVVDAMVEPAGTGRRAARRRWRVGDGPAAAAAGRPARRAGARPTTRRPRRSAPPTSPAWPRACGPNAPISAISRPQSISRSGHRPAGRAGRPAPARARAPGGRTVRRRPRSRRGRWAHTRSLGARWSAVAGASRCWLPSRNACSHAEVGRLAAVARARRRRAATTAQAASATRTTPLAQHGGRVGRRGLGELGADRKRDEVGVDAIAVDRAHVLDRHAVDGTDLGDQQVDEARVVEATTSSSITRPPPTSRISMPRTSPRTAPMRLATWPSAPGRSGSQTRTTTSTRPTLPSPRVGRMNPVLRPDRSPN